MKKRKNKTQESLGREIKIEIPQVNVIEKNSTPAIESTGKLQFQIERLHKFSEIFLKKINNRLGTFHSSVKNGRANNPNIKVQAWSFLVCAIATNLISLYLHFSVDFLIISGTAKLATVLWVISVILAGISAWLFSVTTKKNKKAKTTNQPINSNRQPSIQVLFSNRTFRFMVPILLFAFILRIIPIMNNGLYLDEWYWLDTSRAILKGLVFSPFGFVGDQPSNLPAFLVALLLATIKNPILSVRLPGVIYSLVTIFFVYELLKDILGYKTAIIGSFLLAVSVWDIHMTNLGWNNVNLNPMLASGTLLLFHKINSDKYSIRTLFLLALLISICLHLLYVAALLIIPTLLVLAIHLFKKYSAVKLREVSLFCAYFLICFSPMFPKLVQYPQQSIGRHGDFLQQNINISEETKSQLTYYFDQINLLFHDYSTGKDNFSVEGLWGITLDPAIRLLSGLGILLLIIQAIRKKGDPFWLISFFTFCILIVIPFVLLYRTTSVWRAYIILPLVYLFATYAISQGAKILKFLAKKYYNRKGLRKYFLAAITLLYFIVSIPWFIEFSKVYLKKSTGYENTICQNAAVLINNFIPKGSTIYMPDEMCSPLVRILYDDDQYRFIPITPDTPKPVLDPGAYLIILNSQVYGGYFRENIQKIAEQIINEQNVQLVSMQATSQPVLYLIK